MKKVFSNYLSFFNFSMTIIFVILFVILASQFNLEELFEELVITGFASGYFLNEFGRDS